MNPLQLRSQQYVIEQAIFLGCYDSFCRLIDQEWTDQELLNILSLIIEYDQFFSKFIEIHGDKLKNHEINKILKWFVDRGSPECFDKLLDCISDDKPRDAQKMFEILLLKSWGIYVGNFETMIIHLLEHYPDIAVSDAVNIGPNRPFRTPFEYLIGSNKPNCLAVLLRRKDFEPSQTELDEAFRHLHKFGHWRMLETLIENVNLSEDLRMPKLDHLYDVPLHIKNLYRKRKSNLRPSFETSLVIH